ncbi:hypothetical protein [Ramlibacter sp. PS4R-6]|uniref:hypothetical protein n=1 Tax=Ramlibacter sp. PS4R-6 TaxID=3133438 RepID=UPI003097FBF7
MPRAKSTEQSELEMLNQAQREQEVYALMRQTGRSRVQVLNAMKVRGPEREAVLRALGAR